MDDAHQSINLCRHLSRHFTQVVAGVTVREEGDGDRGAAECGNAVDEANEIELRQPRRQQQQQQQPNDDDDDVGLIGVAPALSLSDRMSAPFNVRVAGRVW